MSLSITPTEKTQEILSQAKDLAIEMKNTQVSIHRCTTGLSTGKTRRFFFQHTQDVFSLPTFTDYLTPCTLPPFVASARQVTPLHVMSALVADDDSMGTGIVRSAGK